MTKELVFYDTLLSDIKTRVRQGQLRANLSANAEMLSVYWDIGKMIHQRQKMEGWGKGVIPRLAKDLKNELSEMKGFSVRNIQMMIQFYNEYQGFGSITQRVVAQLEGKTISTRSVAKMKDQITQRAVAKLQNYDNQIVLIAKTNWAQHTILIQKVKDLSPATGICNNA